MHERLMERAERMAAAGMPYPAAGRISLVGEPDVGFEIVQFIVPDNVLRIADDLQDHHVPAVGHDKGAFLAERRVIMGVNLETVLIDKLVLGVPTVQGGEIIVRDILVQDVVFDADEIPHDIRGSDLETETAVVLDGRQLFGLIDYEVGFDEPVFDLGRSARIQKREVDHIVFVQNLPGNPQRFGNKSHGTDSAALPVAPIMHLQGRLENVLPGHGNGTDESSDAAPAFRLGLRSERRYRAAKRRAGVENLFSVIH